MKISNEKLSFDVVRLDFAAKNSASRMFVELDCAACSRECKTAGKIKGDMLMAVPFISRKRLNPQKLEAEGKFYPAPAYIAEVGVNQLAEEISQSTTLTPTEVIGVIRGLLLTVPKYMLLGYKVRLDSFGIFKLGLKNKASCKGYEKASLVTANDIEGIKVMYTPDAMLKAKLEKPEYVKLDAKYITDEEENTSNGD